MRARSYLFIMTAITASFLAAGRAHAQVSNDEEIAATRKIIEKGAYVSSRGLEDYVLLGSTFAREITQLQPGQWWIDVGAGRGTAIIDYLERDGSAGGVVGITVDVPKYDRRDKALTKYGDRFRYLSGRYLEEYDVPNELPRARVVTDFYGAFAYSPHLDEIVAKSAQMLEVGGHYYVLNGFDSKFQVEHQLTLLTREGKSLSLREYFSMVGCMRVEEARDEDWRTETYALVKECEDVKVPALELVTLRSGTPPRRTYRLAQ